MTKPLDETNASDLLSELIKKADSLEKEQQEVQKEMKLVREKLSSVTDALAAPLIEYLNELSPYDCEQQLIHLFRSSSCENVRRFYQSLLDQTEY